MDLGENKRTWSVYTAFSPYSSHIDRLFVDSCSAAGICVRSQVQEIHAASGEMPQLVR